MAKNLKKIKICNIQKNALNIFKDEEDKEGIAVTADSIKRFGLEAPLVVYQSGGDAKNPEYTLLSGHKRLAALKLCGYKGIDEVPCVVEDKPKDNVTMQEIMLQNNLSRNKPEELEKMVECANQLWATMESARRQKLVDGYLSKFRKEHAGCSEKYIKDNFRPRCDYIREQTGLDISNRTVTNIINRYLFKNKEGFPLPAKKEKEILFKDIHQKLISLSGIIETYELSDKITSKEKKLLSPVKSSIKDMLSEISEA